MDGMHDLGGMHGFGRVEQEPGEPVFHARWEARMFAIASAVPFAVPYPDDRFRPAIEVMAPRPYLRSSYYEKWYEAVLCLLSEQGVLSGAELAGGEPQPLPPHLSPPRPLRPDGVMPAILAGASQARESSGIAPRFHPGERVRTRSTLGAGHTRLPRYARGRCGTVESLHGAFLVADRNAAGDPTPEPLYTVRFAARELWGADAPIGDSLSLDCWDSYLEPHS